MKPKTVKTTTDFVLWLLSKKSARLWDEIWKLHDVDKDNFNNISRIIIHNYAKLMATSLSLEMFVPCKDEKILDMMERNKEWLEENHKAEKKVLFEGWKISNPEQDGYYLTYQKEVNKAFWNTKDLEFELQLGGGFNTIENMEDLCKEIDLISNDNFWKKVGL